MPWDWRASLSPCFFLTWLAYWGGSVLLQAPAAALVAAAAAREPLLATWTQRFGISLFLSPSGGTGT
jgi:hypothetical protein